jgi:hypothetical protein
METNVLVNLGIIKPNQANSAKVFLQKYSKHALQLAKLAIKRRSA